MVLFLGIVISTLASAQELKVAYVELGNVFNNYQKTKDFDAVLQKESQEAQTKLDEMVKKIQDNESKLPLMKDDEKKKLQESLKKQVGEFREFEAQKKNELAKKFDSMRKEILLEVEKVVSNIAKQEQYDYIFNDTVLLYAGNESNLTEKVLKSLNDSYKK
jgi:outer membrane protein